MRPSRFLMPQEREDLRKIQRLQSMNIYPLVRKLTERESADR